MTFQDGQPAGQETEPNLSAAVFDTDSGAHDAALPQDGLDPVQQEARRIMIMRRGLGAVANNPLPDIVLGVMLREFGWEYKKEPGNPPVHHLIKQVMDASIELELPERPTPTSSVRKAEDGLTISVKDIFLRGRDGVTLLDIQSQYLRYLRERGRELHLAEVTLANAPDKFDSSEGKYIREDDPLTDSEAVALGLMTHCGSLKELSAGLGISGTELRKVIGPLFQRLGLEAGSSSPDSYIDLMLTGLALEAANIKHLPFAPESEVQALQGTEEGEILKKYYSPDPQERHEFRSSHTKDYFGSMWSNLFDLVTISKRRKYDAVLYGVKNNILPLPDAAQIRTKLAQGRVLARPEDR